MKQNVFYAIPLKLNQITIKHFNKFYSGFNMDKKTECWNYDKTGVHGYSRIYINEIKKRVPGHRFSYILHNGDISNNLMVLHRCDNPACVNPDHLFLGTHDDNMHDMKEKKRHYRSNQKLCSRGHRIEGKNLYIHSNGKKRMCIACKKITEKIYRKKQKNRMENKK